MKFRIRGGLTGRILRVDLSTGETGVDETEKWAHRFLGGRTVNSAILLEELSPSVRWDDPDNLLIFGAGCLVGTLAPAANRTSVETKNVYGGGKGSANFGGSFGPQLKYAGFDHIIIRGKSGTPVYLYITDDKVELRPADHLWGMTTWQTEEAIRQELHDKRAAVACIGPAGENLVKGACIIADKCKAAGGSGVGCVMGSKKLKAIAVRGHQPIQVADPSLFSAAIRQAWQDINRSPRAGLWRKGNVELGFSYDSPLWDFDCDIIRNGQKAFWPRRRREKLIHGILRFRTGMRACYSCPTGCMPRFQIDEGPYAGLKGDGLWIGSVRYSIRCDVDNGEDALRFHLRCNELGIDGDMASTAISWAFECFEKGLISVADMDGLELRWGDGKAMNAMLDRLACRQGFGDLLANGVALASESVGKGSERFAIYQKGQDTVESYRIQKGWGLGISTSACGPRHLRGAVGTVYHSGPPDLARETWEYANQPEAVFWMVRMKEIEDMTGICNYMGSYSGPHALGVAHYLGLLKGGLGIDMCEEELMELARAGCNLEKAFNTLHAGFGRLDDFPPRRYVEEPVSEGPFKGHRCDPDRWNEMLNRLYELHEWDVNTGWQTRSCLAKLDLNDVAQKLESVGRLIAR